MIDCGITQAVEFIHSERFCSDFESLCILTGIYQGSDVLGLDISVDAVVFLGGDIPHGLISPFRSSVIV